MHELYCILLDLRNLIEVLDILRKQKDSGFLTKEYSRLSEIRPRLLLVQVLPTVLLKRISSIYLECLTNLLKKGIYSLIFIMEII